MSADNPAASNTPDLDLSIRWHSLTSEEVVAQLGTAQNEGLTSEEAARRLERFGPNQLQEQPRPGFLQRLIGQLKNFIVILLIVASIISALLGDYI